MHFPASPDASINDLNGVAAGADAARLVIAQ